MCQVPKAAVQHDPGVHVLLQCHQQVRKGNKEKTTPFGVNLMSSLVYYQAAQVKRG